MIAFVKRLWAAAPFATAVLAVALAATLLFGVRSALFWANRHDRIDHEQPVAAWMTPGYIAHSWHVPREVVLEALDAPEKPTNGPMNIDQIAAMNGTDAASLIAETEAAIKAWRAEHEPPPPGEGAPDAPPPDAPPPAPPAAPDEGGGQ